jgi:hypothetical protein
MKQLTIVAPDRPGLLAELTDGLAADGINIETIDAVGFGDTAVFRLTVNEYDRALQALHRRGFQPVSEDALVVRLEDRPGALAAIARRFRDAGVNLRSLRIIHTSGGQTVAAIATDRTDRAIEIVKDILLE